MVEPLDSAIPRLRCRNLVVAFRRGIIEEAVNASVRDGAETSKTTGLITTDDIFINDIANPGPGDVVFRAEDTSPNPSKISITSATSSTL